MKRLFLALPFFFLLAAGAGRVPAAEEAPPADPAPLLDSAPEGSFTVVVIPDTHAGPENRNEIFDGHTRWIVENLADQRVVFVSHAGDIVNRRPGYGSCEDLAPWHFARRCMDRLHGLVPYALAPGNHDISGSDSSRFQEFFPVSRFADFDWYGGFFPSDHPTRSGNNANSYQLFSAAGHDFVFLHLENNAPDDVLEWAGEILAAHADRLALVTTHMDLGPLQSPAMLSRTVVDEEGRRRSASWHFVHAPKGRMTWAKNHGSQGNSPQAMWEKLYRHHANLRVIFSGDQSRTEAFYQADTGDHGNVVHALMSDYASGPLRLYRFLPAENALRVITFDTVTEKLVTAGRRVPEMEQHQFTLPFDFRPAVPARLPQAEER